MRTTTTNGMVAKRELHSFKVVLLGDTSVGKTSILVRFVENTFQDLQQSTIGAAFQSVDVDVNYSNDIDKDNHKNNHKDNDHDHDKDGHDQDHKNYILEENLKRHIARLQIWDTAGQEQYHSLASMYYRGCHAAIIVYDVSNLESFKRAKVWIHELNQTMAEDDWERAVVILAGNKLDLCEDIYHSKYTTTNTENNNKNEVWSHTRLLSPQDLDRILSTTTASSSSADQDKNEIMDTSSEKFQHKYNKSLRKVTFEMGMQFAKEKRLYFMETSAKYGTNVKTLFNTIANILYTQYKHEESTQNNNNTNNSKKPQGFRIHGTSGQGFSDSDSKILKEADFTKKKWCC